VLEGLIIDGIEQEVRVAQLLIMLMDYKEALVSQVHYCPNKTLAPAA
jgi:hypothetical protein